MIERNGHRFGFLAYTYDQSNGNHPDQDDRIAMLEHAPHGRGRVEPARLAPMP